MGYSKNLAYMWTMFLDSMDVTYQFDSGSGIFSVPDISIGNKVKSFTIYVSCGESDFKVKCSFQEMVPDRNKDQMAILLTKINYNMYYGRYFLDYSDGEMGFVYTVDYEDGIATMQMLRNGFHFAVSSAKNWGDAMMDVAKGRLSGLAAYDKYK